MFCGASATVCQMWHCLPLFLLSPVLDFLYHGFPRMILRQRILYGLCGSHCVVWCLQLIPCANSDTVAWMPQAILQHHVCRQSCEALTWRLCDSPEAPCVQCCISSSRSSRGLCQRDVKRVQSFCFILRVQYYESKRTQGMVWRHCADSTVGRRML